MNSDARSVFMQTKQDKRQREQQQFDVLRQKDQQQFDQDQNIASAKVKTRIASRQLEHAKQTDGKMIALKETSVELQQKKVSLEQAAATTNR